MKIPRISLCSFPSVRAAGRAVIPVIVMLLAFLSSISPQAAMAQTECADEDCSLFLPLLAHREIPQGYRENFETPESGWPTRDDEFYTLRYVEGEYEIIVKQVRGGMLAFPRDQSFTNYAVQVDLRATQVRQQMSFGLVFDHVGTDDYAVLMVDSTGYFTLHGWRGGQFYSLEDWQETDALQPAPATNRLRLERQGENYIAFINDQEVARGTLASPGRAVELGLILFAHEGNVPVAVRADNFEVQPLPVQE